MTHPAGIYSRGIPIFAAASGAVLSVMAPIGMIASTASPLFQNLFLVQAVLLACAAVLGVIFSIRLSASLGAARALLPIALTAGLLGALWLSALPPVSDPRALAEALFAAKQWSISGRITEISWHEPSYAPALTAPAWTALFTLQAVKYAPFFNTLYLAALAGMCAVFAAERTGSSGAGLLGWFFTLSMPALVRFAAIPGVDPASALFCLTAAVSLIRWFEEPGRFADLAAAALSAGAAGACGYKGLLATTAMACAAPILAARSKKGAVRSLAGLVFFAGTAAALCGSWPARNAYLKINPIFPAAKEILAAPDGALKFEAPPLRPYENRLIQHPGGWKGAALLPWMMLTAGKDASPREFDGVLSPVLLLALFPLINALKKPWIAFLAAISGGYALAAFCLTPPSIPILIPILGVLAALAACGARQMSDVLTLRLRGPLLAAIAAAQLLFGGLYIHDLLRRKDAAAALQPGFSAEEYLRRTVPEMPLIDHARRSLSAESRIFLFLAGDHFFFYDRQILSEGGNRSEFFESLADQTDDPRIAAGELLNRGVTHLLWNSAAEAAAWEPSLSRRQLDMWRAFKEGCLEVTAESGPFKLARIVRPPNRGEPEEGGQ